FVVNDDVHLALKLGADGLHLGQEDASILEAAKQMPASFPVGISVSTVEEAVRAEQQGASYLGVGPVFVTQTKPGKKPIGIEAIREIKDKVTIPVVAIGGIDETAAVQIREAG